MHFLHKKPQKTISTLQTKPSKLRTGSHFAKTKTANKTVSLSMMIVIVNTTVIKVTIIVTVVVTFHKNITVIKISTVICFSSCPSLVTDNRLKRERICLNTEIYLKVYKILATINKLDR